MFYTRINKIKVFNNREGFLGLFNHAEICIPPTKMNRSVTAGNVSPLHEQDRAANRINEQLYNRLFVIKIKGVTLKIL
jgi:hypothetical protein